MRQIYIRGSELVKAGYIKDNRGDFIPTDMLVCTTEVQKDGDSFILDFEANNRHLESCSVWVTEDQIQYDSSRGIAYVQGVL